MAAKKKDNLPVNVEDTEKASVITYSNEVITTIASTAVSEVDGIAEMTAVPSSGLLGKKAASAAKGLKVELTPETAAVDLYIVVEYGTPIQQCAVNAQEAIRRAIETMTDLKVLKVDVHVQGVSFEKDKNANEAGKTIGLDEGEATPKPRKSRKKAEPAAKAEQPVEVTEPVQEPAEETAAVDAE